MNPILARKLLAGVVIAGCLGAQAYVTWRPSGSRLWPFVDYPMYASASRPGTVFRLRELRGRGCEEGAPAVRIAPRVLGHQETRFLNALRAIAVDAAGAPAHRALLTRGVVEHVTPRPCALEVWERVVPIGADGVDASALHRPRWVPLRGWPVADPDAVASLDAPAAGRAAWAP